MVGFLFFDFFIKLWTVFIKTMITFWKSHFVTLDRNIFHKKTTIIAFKYTGHQDHQDLPYNTYWRDFQDFLYNWNWVGFITPIICQNPFVQFLARLCCRQKYEKWHIFFTGKFAQTATACHKANSFVKLPTFTDGSVRNNPGKCWGWRSTSQHWRWTQEPQTTRK